MKLQFRGQRIWGAVIQHLLDVGMASAEHVLLTGCSAGGLAAILHCDQLRALLPAAATVKCLSDGGLFLDAYVLVLCPLTRLFFSKLAKPIIQFLSLRALQRGRRRRQEPEVILRRRRRPAGGGAQPSRDLHRPSRRHLGAYTAHCIHAYAINYADQFRDD